MVSVLFLNYLHFLYHKVRPPMSNVGHNLYVYNVSWECEHLRTKIICHILPYLLKVLTLGSNSSFRTPKVTSSTNSFFIILSTVFQLNKAVMSSLMQQPLIWSVYTEYLFTLKQTADYGQTCVCFFIFCISHYYLKAFNGFPFPKNYIFKGYIILC